MLPGFPHPTLFRQADFLHYQHKTKCRHLSGFQRPSKEHTWLDKASATRLLTGTKMAGGCRQNLLWRNSALTRHVTLPRLWTSSSAFIRNQIHLTRRKCTQSDQSPSCHDKKSTKLLPAVSSLTFWASPPTWKRATINTLRCLVGCTLGDFSSMWYLQAFHPTIGIEVIMAISSKLVPCVLETNRLLSLDSGQRPIDLHDARDCAASSR
jgi:hypothetical protein